MTKYLKNYLIQEWQSTSRITSLKSNKVPQELPYSRVKKYLKNYLILEH